MGLFLGVLNLLAVLPPQHAELPDIDRRETVASPLTATQKSAVSILRKKSLDAKVDFDPVRGVQWITDKRGFLTGPNGEGRSVSVETAQALPANDPHRATKAFLNEHSGLFGHDSSLLSNAQVKREFTAPKSGLHTVVWEQQFEDTPIFENVLISHTTKKGELVNLSSSLMADPSGSAKRGMPRRVPGVVAIDARNAIVAAAADLGDQVLPAQVTSVNAAQGDRYQSYSTPALKGPTRARLVWLPMDRNSLRLCWEILLTSRSQKAAFRMLVDSETAKVWLRQGLTHNISDATFRVYTSDSPSPFSPTYPSATTNQPPLIARSLVVTNPLSTNASPHGWIEDGDNETRGNNVDAHLDRDDDDEPDLPRPHGSPDRVFDFPMDLTQPPSSYGNASVVQLFYWCNWIHDKLYDLGFNEAAGNFQTDNFNRGGWGNDAVEADSQDGGSFNNANMTTFPDGMPPRLQMYVFDGPTPNRDGALDAEVVLHEYCHGLTWRRVGGGVGITSLQTRGISEGWSDFYALSLLSEPGDDVNAPYAMGGYITAMMSGLSQNYYFGIRRYPYTTDMVKNPLSFKDIDPSQAGGHPGIPVSPIYGNSPAAEIHAQGEVWCVALWEARANLIQKCGYEIGNQLMLQLVTDALNLSPPNPNFLQARDAIIQADRVGHSGTNYNELWAAFAKRGMGFTATCPPNTTTIGVHESFDLPDDLLISPADTITFSGPSGGPFSPASFTYALTNAGSNQISWTATCSSAWLNLSSGGGNIPPGSPEISLTAMINTNASLLAEGIYMPSIYFTNTVNNRSQVRKVVLSVGQLDYFTQNFDLGNNDLHNQSLTFTPNGSSSFYSVCREPAPVFPVDPRLGKRLLLTDDSYATIVLAAGAQVSLYGKRTNIFYIGSNGYITFDEGDSAYTGTLATHFARRRISGLFADLNPESGGRISWQQLVDRAVVTFEDITQYQTGSRNSFQIELFFDGRIRLTHLNIGSATGLVGLSAGNDIPATFVPSDLSAYPSCSMCLRLSLPSTAVEGMGTLTNAGRVSLPVPSTGDVVIALRSSDVSEVILPYSVTIPAGQTNAEFNVTIGNDIELDGNQFAILTASAPGYVTATAQTIVSDNEVGTISLSAPASATEKAGVLGAVVSVNTPVSTNVLIQLTSSRPQRLQAPASVIIPAGSTQAPFAIAVLDDTQLNGNEFVQLTAHVQNWNDGTTQVQILDDETNSLSLTLPTQLSEISGPVTGSSFVRLGGSLSTNLVVTLVSSDTNRLSVPTEVTLSSTLGS